MFRIVIDARTVAARKSGIGNYVEALVQHMVPIADDLRFVLLRQPGDRAPIIVHERVEEIEVPGETKSLNALWVGQGRFGEADLFHAPTEVVPRGIRCPWVVTLHDMMWVERPRLASAFLPVRTVNSVWYRLAFRHALEGAAGVIAISQATADATARIYPAHAHKIHVIHHGLDRARYDPERAGPRSSIERIVPPGVRYSLMIGQGSPYKNHDGMIRAFVDATRDDPGHKLVLVRRFARVDLAMRRLLQRDDVRAKVIAVPFITDDEILTLYRHAVALLFASHYEGFGLPALEAMAMGLPALVSTHPALQEVTAGAALEAVSTDHGDLVGKIRMLSRDADLRARLAEAGKRRVAELSWEDCARRTLDVYREAIRATAARR